MSKMAVTGDVSLADNGGKHIHPYVVALVRWCVSCVWGAATLLLQRLLAPPLLPSIAASLPARPGSRAASSGHIHPEPRVQCAVLHAPAARDADIVFVHGLYGSLENTWRQGDWRSKYKIEPNKIPLRRQGSLPGACTSRRCVCNSSKPYKQTHASACICAANVDMETHHYDRFSEGFVDIDGINLIDNYEMQADFVRKLFDCENSNCSFGVGKNSADENCNDVNEKCFQDTKTANRDNDTDNDNHKSHKFTVNFNKDTSITTDKVNQETKTIEQTPLDLPNSVEVKDSEKKTEQQTNQHTNSSKSCDVGCGCICARCYSSCWPRDWLSVDVPTARVISVNYTSDPHLWRPLWVKECKRLRLHERAEQMTAQLLALGVGEVPVVWVGHSKGGLFIKQIYAEAYEAHLKTQNSTEHRAEGATNYGTETDRSAIHVDINPQTSDDSVLISLERSDVTQSAINVNMDSQVFSNHNTKENNEVVNNDRINDKHATISKNLETNKETSIKNTEEDNTIPQASASPLDQEAHAQLARRARLWSRSAGFMFYSVPHRGSALADIKTPLTARSVELLEISKDCSLVLSLQARWLRAALPAQPAVRSLVETARTLMAVLWLRIVSVESADAGVGALCGVAVDHREICKPSGRGCVLYTELLKLIHAGLGELRP